MRPPTLVVTALALMVAAACTDSALQPEADFEVPTTQGKLDNNGSGAVFYESPYTGIQHTDADGDHCLVENDETRSDDANDWVRWHKGRYHIHINDAVATLTLTMASGEVFTGQGRWSVNWRPNNQLSTAVGTVSDGTTMYRARCAVRQGRDGYNVVEVF